MVCKAKDTNAVFGGYTNIRWENHISWDTSARIQRTGDGSTFLWKMLDDNSVQKFKHVKGAEITNYETEIAFGQYDYNLKL